MAMAEPVTIGDLRRGGQLLEVGCRRCWNVRYLDPFSLPFGHVQPVPTAHKRMKCSVCGADGSQCYSRPDARVRLDDGVMR